MGKKSEYWPISFLPSWPKITPIICKRGGPSAGIIPYVVGPVRILKGPEYGWSKGNRFHYYLDDDLNDPKTIVHLLIARYSPHIQPKYILLHKDEMLPVETSMHRKATQQARANNLYYPLLGMFHPTVKDDRSVQLGPTGMRDNHVFFSIDRTSYQRTIGIISKRKIYRAAAKWAKEF